MCLDELERRGRFGRERREGSARIRQGALDGIDAVTARPQTYMNLSGRAAVHLVRTFGMPPADVIVVHDEADFPLGKVRIKVGGSSAGHRGVQSLIDSLRTDGFTRVRIGVGRPGERNDLVEHVLDPFLPEEREQAQAVVVRAADAVVAVMRDGPAAAMNVLNRDAAG